MSYAWQQLQCAVRALSGTSEQRERLVVAYNKLVKLRPKDLPAEVAADFELLVGSIPRYPAKNVLREVKTEVHSLTDTQVTQAIAVISAMHEAVSVYQPRRVHCAMTVAASRQEVAEHAQ
ncbi:MAG TPA: hypothetical protein VJ698_19500 [Noviherbaspirillum sp.]|uniref:hypothetical protein n=1 Tax=Noviherbaspirillum sp. TaxID=1926288 RepID=UPI002B4707E2|nr:hypothetical protein [Noviherbaspirillum sp.]HJV87664.1 hypothetical protein [Noviherbaspirillum sp.]